LRLDERIDVSIIECLEKNGKLHYNGLYAEVCSTYKGISPDTFSSHLKKLVADRYIEKSSNGIGRKAWHSLTDKARRQARMRTLDFRSEKERVKPGVRSKGIKHQNLYILLLLFRHPSIYKFDTETGYDNFLSQFKLTRQQLIQTSYPKFICLSGDRSYQYLETAWKSNPNDIETTRQDVIHRKDSTGKLHRVTQPEFYYYCTVKGLTEREIVDSDLRFASSSFEITKEQAKEAFGILRAENLLRPIAKYNDEILYAISDERLDKFLQGCLEIYEFISDSIIGVWNFRNPKPQEKEWFEFFVGKEGTNRIIIRALDRRKAKNGMTTNEFLDWLKWQKGNIKDSETHANEMITNLKKKNESTIQKYPYPCEDILNLVYPKFLKDTFQIIKKNR
jgi:DNA-binding HxlR family transcriptional regulator